MKDRIKQLQKVLADHDCDAFFSLSPADNAYLASFFGTASAVIITQDEAVFLCDFRYTEQARQQVEYCSIHEITGSMEQRVAEFLNKLKVAKAGYNPGMLTVSQLDLVRHDFDGEFKDLSDAVACLRMIKSPDEIELIRKAATLAEVVMAQIQEACTPGIQEKELAALLTYELLRQGADGTSFDPIILFGARSSLPHGKPGEKQLVDGDVVLIDMGCILQGYCSDITRTCVFKGIPGEWFDDIYQTTLLAQESALSAIKPNVLARDVDAVARDIIRDAGFGQYFGHGLGHGVGLEIHEPPRLNMQSETLLQTGMVITVEPGIYLPGQGGVRIEDLVVVTDTGCERLTPSSKALKVLT